MHQNLHAKDVYAFVVENTYDVCFQNLTHQMQY